VFFIVLVSS